MGEMGDRLRAAVAAALVPGEEVRGVLIATQASTFKASPVAVATTDRRLIIQKLNRKLEADGPAASLPPERIADASVDGAGGGWLNVNAVIMSGAAVTLRLRTTDGDKFKLMMMRGGGNMFGKLGGGQDQESGVAALTDFLADR